jgi:uncharacterized protein (DUF1330 family)
MQPRCMAALAVVVGFVAGVVTVHGLHAQAQPPAYVVVEIVDVQQLHDFTKEFVPLAMKALTDQGGKVLAPPDFVGSIEGRPPKQAALIAFESMDRAIAAFGSAAFQNARTIGAKYTTYRIYAVPGSQ